MRTRARQGVQHESRTLVAAHLTFGQQHEHRPSPVVADRVELGVQSTLGAPDTAGKSPFLRAAVRCAFR